MTSDTSQRDRAAPVALTRLLDGDDPELRASIRKVLEHPEVAPVTTLQTDAYRARVYEPARSLADEGLTANGFPGPVRRPRDPEADEFVIVTPTDSDRTEYIGNPACHGRMAAVFAQLVVAGDQHGVHALVMPLHDERGELLEAIPDAVLGAPIGLRDAAD